MNGMSELLQLTNLTKKYGSFLANDNVSFTLKKGEVHALVGENGAGKTTLMRMLYGMEKPSSGSVQLHGKSVSFSSPADAIKNGIGMVHQHFMVFPHFSVAENIVLGHEPKKGLFFNRRQAKEDVQQLTQTYQISVDVHKKVKHCSIGEQQKIEILKVLYQGAEIIVLDEPTAVLTPHEVKELLKTIRFLASQGKSIIIITHKLQEVMEVADRITVLRNGKVAGVTNKESTNAHHLAKLMVGRELKERPARVPSQGTSHLSVQNLFLKGKGQKNVLQNVSLHVSAGEIVGIAGVSGNGQSELLQAIAGLVETDSGSIKLGDEDLTGRSVRERREVGIAHIPEDRYMWGASKDDTIEENALMGYQYKASYSKMGWLKRKVFSSSVNEWINEFSIKATSSKQKAGELSGGNLQKLIVARELGQNTSFLLAAEPTRGVDIGAMERIHDALIQKRNNGSAILLVSSELSEIISLSDRILVMYEGSIVGELTREEATEEKLSILMAGGTVEGDTVAETS